MIPWLPRSLGTNYEKLAQTDTSLYKFFIYGIVKKKFFVWISPVDGGGFLHHDVNSFLLWSFLVISSVRRIPRGTRFLFVHIYLFSFLFHDSFFWLLSICTFCAFSKKILHTTQKVLLVAAIWHLFFVSLYSAECLLVSLKKKVMIVLFYHKKRLPTSFAHLP